MLSRFCLQLMVFSILGFVAEGRPKTLKKCGRSALVMGRIIGGKFVQPGEFPWMVSLQEQRGYRFKHVCGGTILNEHYIITAAHCIDYPSRAKKYAVYTGVHQLSKKHRRPAKKYKIVDVTVHEDYDEETYENDVALLRTKDPIQVAGSSGYVNAVCLPQDDEDPTGWAVVTGWGHTEEDGDISDFLQSVKVPLVPRKLCQEAYENDSIDIQDSQICAGIVDRDSCQYDSGGPLIQKNKKGIFSLIGVVSFGIGCGQVQYPGVYTKVASYMDWLEENMF